MLAAAPDAKGREEAAVPRIRRAGSGAQQHFQPVKRADGGGRCEQNA